jgi:hypothetical protein
MSGLFGSRGAANPGVRCHSIARPADVRKLICSSIDVIRLWLFRENNMKIVNGIIAFVLLLVPASVARAQSAIPAPHPERPHDITRVLDFWLSETEKLVVPAADAMPEDKYAFAPTGGEFKGVRTFAEQVKHLAAANYQLAAGALGENPPAGTDNESAPDALKTKAEIMDYLRGSFALLLRAAASIDAKNMEQPIKSMGGRTRLWLLVDAVAHSSNHYGQMVEYLRMNNIVPPASR